MKGTSIIRILCLFLIFTADISITRAQGIGNILERLNNLEKKLNQLDALQRRETAVSEKMGTEMLPDTKISEVNTIVLEHGARLLALEECIAQIKLKSAELDGHETERNIDSVLTALTLKIDQLEEDYAELKRDGVNSENEGAGIAAELTADLRALLVELKSVISKNSAGDRERVYATFPTDLYGYIKLDISYDDSRLSIGNYARWAELNGAATHQYSITARQTRFGFNFRGPQDEHIAVSGKAEIDFYGGGAENKSMIMMRHAYLKVFWPKSNVSIVAGQAGDVISPLNPGTLNYTVMWWAGNIGYRRPQLRLAKEFKLSGTSRLNVELAATRTTGSDEIGTPIFQGRSSLSFPLFSQKITTIGISAHSGEEEDDTRTWSVNSDLSLPIHSKVLLQGEYWHGENLDAYLGGIGQGLNTLQTGVIEIASFGGWAALSIGPFSNWRVNLGTSIDDPDDSHLKDGDRVRNNSIFANVVYALHNAIEIGCEVSYWETGYKNLESGSCVRLQSSMIYKF